MSCLCVKLARPSYYLGRKDQLNDTANTLKIALKSSIDTQHVVGALRMLAHFDDGNFHCFFEAAGNLSCYHL